VSADARETDGIGVPVADGTNRYFYCWPITSSMPQSS
jgi:hypothetical protein